MSDKIEGTEGHLRVLKGTQGYSGNKRVLQEKEGYSAGYSEDSNNYPIVEEPPLNRIYNLKAEIVEYTENQPGAFSIADIDRDLGIGRDQARNRKKILSALYKEKKIIRVKTGVYERANVELEKILRRNIDVSPFDIKLPLGLSNLVRMPKKSIIIIAGVSNAGKSFFALETARLNINKDYNIAYFMSEMGESEFIERIDLIHNNDQSASDKMLDKMHSAVLSSGFSSAIASYTPNGLGIIDYLEATDGEYFKLTNDIKMIYDRLEDGVALICMQKGSNVEYARGGEGTKEKARLYINLDTIFEDEFSSLVCMQIVKAKNPIGRNVTGLEMHLEVSRQGMIPISDWMRLKGTKEMVKRKRVSMFEEYQEDSHGDREVRKLGAKPVVNDFEKTSFTPDETKVEGLF